jgi:cation diffusion facilitator CzcD-associated flavoprotein CzcO
MWRNESALFMTPMYDALETNIPVDLMKFSDLDFPINCQLFPPREVVLKYLEEHGADVEHLVKFQSQVFGLRLLAGERETWQLESRNLATDKEICEVYDAVAICSGHYTVPYIPEYPGLDKWHGEHLIRHSKYYRSADSQEFRGKKVLIIGNGASGMDIAHQIAEVSLAPLLLSQRRESLFSSPPNSAENSRMEILPAVTEFMDPIETDRSIKFANGHIESRVDIVLFATGYLYNYPFLDSQEIRMVDDGMRVKNTYQHLFNIDHPSLAMPGLPLKVLPFPLGEAQAAVLARVWSGRLQLPSKEEMRQWEANTLQINGDGRAFHTLLFPKDFEYQNELADWAGSVEGKQPPRFDDRAAWARARFPAIKRTFAGKGEARHSIRTLEELGYDYEAWKREDSLNNA